MASASDNFDRADGAIGANWTAVNGNWVVSGNLCVERTTTGIYYHCWYDATVPASNDFYSEAILLQPSGGTLATGPSVRMAAAAVTGYNYPYFGGDFSYLTETAAGVETVLDTGSAVTAATNYTGRLEANGTALTGTRGGAADVSATDATLASGNWGLITYGGVSSGTTQAMNTWIAADLAAASGWGALLSSNRNRLVAA